MVSGAEGLPSLAVFIASLSGDDPAPGSAGAVVALTAALAADLAGQVARQSPAWAARADALRSAGSISDRAIALAGDVDRTYARAVSGLSRPPPVLGAHARANAPRSCEKVVTEPAEIL